MDFQTYAVQELKAVAEKLADTAKRQLDATTAQLTATFEETINRLRNDQTEIVTENERLTAENAALSWEKDQLAEAARNAAPAGLISRLHDVFERIAQSTTVDEVVIAAAHGLIEHFGRVGVFIDGTQVVQLGPEAPLLDLASSSIVSAPMTVRGDTLATLYADDQVHPGGEGAQLAALLQRHATLALERLTVELKAIGELRAYAQMLLDEVEYVFNADIAANVPEADRLEHLKENVRCARQIYGQRITLEGPAAAAVLDDVVARILEGKAAMAFGRELASLEDDAALTKTVGR
jgi:hypothetical protein